MDKGEDGDSHVIDLSEHFSPNNEAQSFPIGIRSIHTTETEIIVNRSWTIIQLKEKLKEINGLSDKHLRIIYNGREPTELSLLHQVGIRPNSIIHVTASNRAPRRSHRPSPTHTSNRNSTNSHTAHQQEDEDEEEEVRGFDRLLEMGFSPVDVRQIRLQFYTEHFRRGPNGRPLAVPPASELLDMEDEWIDQHGASNGQQQQQNQHQQPNHLSQVENVNPAVEAIGLSGSIASSGVEGNSFNLFIGLILGFIMGLVMLFWITDNSLTRKTRTGIMCGIFINAVFGFLFVVRST